MQKHSRTESECPIIAMIDLIGAKWTVEILRELSIQPTRTRQFLTRIPGVSMKCLIERLKALEAYGMLVRIEYEEKVLHVEYAITERGRKLFAIMTELKALAADFMEVTCKCPMESSTMCAKCDSEHAGELFDCPVRRSQAQAK